MLDILYVTCTAHVLTQKEEEKKRGIAREEGEKT